jgi:endogenous inhibitor of DNA gyrase (YacG/DUF329 family)
MKLNVNKYLNKTEPVLSAFEIKQNMLEFIFKLFPCIILSYINPNSCFYMNKTSNKNQETSPALVAHVCNPSYSGGRDQENHGSKPAQANSSVRPYCKKTFTKIELMEWLNVKALSLSPSAANKQTKKPRNLSVICQESVTGLLSEHI